LPRPVTDLKAVRKGERVMLTWTIPSRTTERQSVRYLGNTRVCRNLSASSKGCEKVVGEVAPFPDFAEKQKSGKKLTGSYEDVLPQNLSLTDPFATASYAVDVQNLHGRSAGLSNRVHVPLALTLPAPADFAAQVRAQGIVLTWSAEVHPANGPVHYRYRVYRRAEDGKRQALVGEVFAGDSPSYTLTDTSFEWEKTYFYEGKSVTLLAEAGKPEEQIEGDSTAEIKVVAHDVFPPGVPTGLQAVFSGPGQQPFIDLVWLPVSDSDLAGYNVYRREEGGPLVKLNAELEKTPAFRDSGVAAGKTYVYSVSAVDARGNESARSEEASESVP
jgi:hypothetical protein